MQELSGCSQEEAALHREEFSPTVRAIVFGESSSWHSSDQRIGNHPPSLLDTTRTGARHRGTFTRVSRTRHRPAVCTSAIPARLPTHASSCQELGDPRTTTSV